MYLKVYIGALVLISAFCTVIAQWQNGWDKNLHVDCNPGEALHAVESVHSKYYGDRRWLFKCKHLVKAFSSCYWTDYQNAFNQPLLFQCAKWYVMTGVSSYHSNHHEDRRWRYRCCTAHYYTPKNCALTGYINNWDAYMKHYARYGTVFVGAFSYHDNKKEDRRWKMLECSLSSP